MATQSSFPDRVARARDGDSIAARDLVALHFERLIALAGSRLNSLLRRKEDPEDIVQSVLKSFFVGLRRFQFDLPDEQSLWYLLASNVRRKCADRARHYGAAKRDARLEEPAQCAAGNSSMGQHIADPQPTPQDAAILTETVERLLESLKNDRDREIVRLLLCGNDVATIRDIMHCSSASAYRARNLAKAWLQGSDP